MKDCQAELLSPVYRWPYRVYYSDTDAMGAVYHANFLTFFERARAHLLMDRGYFLKDCESDGVMFVVHAANLNYVRPLMLDDTFEIRSAITHCKRASMVWRQEIIRDSDDALICTADIQVVCVSPELKPQAVPASMLQKVCDPDV